MSRFEERIMELIRHLREEIRMNDQRIKQLSGGGSGLDLSDLMLKAIYDTDNDGVVDKAERVTDSKFNILQVDGDLWIVANAQYDATVGQWNRIDTSKFAFALQIQGTNFIPGEPVQGVNLWRAVPGDNPIGDFGTYGGWEAVQIWTAYKDAVLGGYGLEIDGNGITPYGRFVHSILSSVVHSGILTNFFADFSGRDNTSAPSWFAGIAGDEFAVKRAAGATPTWQNPFRIDSSGRMFFAPPTEEPDTADMQDGELCFFIDLNASALKAKYRYSSSIVFAFTVAYMN